MASFYKTTAFKTSDGKLFEDITEASEHQKDLDLELGLKPIIVKHFSSTDGITSIGAEIVHFFKTHRCEIVDILRGINNDDNNSRIQKEKV